MLYGGTADPRLSAARSAVLCVRRVLCGETVPYFLNKLSNAARALLGRKLAGVEVSFSRVTRSS